MNLDDTLEFDLPRNMLFCDVLAFLVGRNQYCSSSLECGSQDNFNIFLSVRHRVVGICRKDYFFLKPER